MQKNATEPHFYSEDEIDLKELLKTLWLSKGLIIVITASITILAGIYAFVKTPIYEATALVEIGSYKLHNNGNGNGKAMLGTAADLSKKLNVLFIDAFKNEKNQTFQVSSITVPRKVTSFIEIKAEAISNALAKRAVLNVVEHIQSDHQKILEDVKNRRELEIQHINDKISNINNGQIQSLNEKINLQQTNLNDYKQQLDAIGKNIENIENSNPALTALKLMEKRDLSELVLQLSLQLMEMRNQKERLQTTTISRLVEQKQFAKSMLLPHNYKNSKVVGQIITNHHPIKPKKKLIIAIAFLLGLVLSILLVFIMNAFKADKDKKQAAEMA